MSYNVDPNFPAYDLVEVTPSDVTSYQPAFRQVYVGTGGNLSVETTEGTVVVFNSLASGSFVGPFYVSKIMSTNTTCSDIIGFYWENEMQMNMKMSTNNNLYRSKKSPVSLTSYRYYKVGNIVVSGGLLEITELHFGFNSNRVPSSVIVPSLPPDFNNASLLDDDDVNVRPYWGFDKTPILELVYDYSSPVLLNSIRQASFDTLNRQIDSITIFGSNDNSDYTILYSGNIPKASQNTTYADWLIFR